MKEAKGKLIMYTDEGKRSFEVYSKDANLIPEMLKKTIEYSPNCTRYLLKIKIKETK